MADPSGVQILDLIEARFANMTTANGYYFDVQKIARSTLKPFDGIDLPAINFWVASVTNAVDRHRRDLRTENLFVEYHSKTYDDPFIDVVKKLEADVINGLNRAVASPAVSDSQSRNLGGVVRSLRWTNTSYQIFRGQKPFCGAFISFSLEYGAPLNDMTTYYD